MKKLLISLCFCIICLLIDGQMFERSTSTMRANTTKSRERDHSDDRLNLPHTAGQLQALLQRINDRLTTTEAIGNQQLRKLDNIDYRITRLEVLGHEKSNVDKFNEQFSRKLDNIEWEINKYATLLDVIRQDLDKIEQRQTELKVAFSSNTIQSLVSSKSASTASSREVYEDNFSATAITDVPSKLNSLNSQMRNLSKTVEHVQKLVTEIGLNLTDVSNTTRTVSNAANQMLTKQYFTVAIREILQTSKPEPLIDYMVLLRRLSMTTDQKCQNDERSEQRLPSDCGEVQEVYGRNKSGVYRIQPRSLPEPLFAYCDLESDGGGWTVIQRREDGNMDFYRDWMDYKYGFGNVVGEHWLGNENIHRLTKQGVYELRIELEDFEAVTARATYSSFAVGSESDGYMIKLLGNYVGDAGDSFTYHTGVKFSTRDLDQDRWDGGNCAEAHTGGWWYKGCDMANLNGRYLAGDVPEDLHYQGVYWYEWHGPEYSLQKTVMMIRPKSFNVSQKIDIQD